MAHKIEMSLDDIIKLEHPKQDENRRGVDHSRGKDRSRSHARSGTSDDGEDQPRRGVLKGHNRGGIQRSPRNARGDTNSSWKYDMNDEPGRRRVLAAAGVGGNAKLIVSNLASGTSEHDIQQLFEDIGPLKSVQMHYDRTGQSLGAANVLFEYRDDAAKAMKQYNGVRLDGRYMNIELAVSDPPSSPASSRRGGGSAPPRFSRNQPNYGPPRGDYQTNRRGNRGGNQRNHHRTEGSQRQHQEAKTAEELDAELDEYRNNVK